MTDQPPPQPKHYTLYESPSAPLKDWMAKCKDILRRCGKWEAPTIPGKMIIVTENIECWVAYTSEANKRAVLDSRWDTANKAILSRGVDHTDLMCFSDPFWPQNTLLDLTRLVPYQRKDWSNDREPYHPGYEPPFSR